MYVDHIHVVFPFLSNSCASSTPSQESFVCFVCPTEIAQLSFAWKYYLPLCMGESDNSFKKTLCLINKCPQDLLLSLVGPQEKLRGPSGYTPREFTSSPGREAKYRFSGCITTNKQIWTNKQSLSFFPHEPIVWFRLCFLMFLTPLAEVTP